MKTYEIIAEELKQKGIQFETIQFTDQIISARVNSSNDNYKPEEAVKTVIISRKGELIAALVRGFDLIDGKKFKQYIGKDWRMASSVELETIGFIPGTVCPLILPKTMPIYIDEEVTKLAMWNLGSGDLDKGLLIETKEALKHLSQGQIVDIAKPKISINN